MHDVTRRRLVVQGQVQGVGFRPFVYRLALELGLTGLVRNAPEGVVVEVQGARAGEFRARLEAELPPLARIVGLEETDAEGVAGEAAFRIEASAPGQGHAVLISPDVATCADCLADMADPDNRRFGYPFTNCTNCGPRYTITRSIPYDRATTSMACFPLCEACRAEYENPLDRRFHAQPNACPVCGPRVWLTDRQGARLAEGPQALERLARELAEGAICAVKGLGGFHLACDAANEAAVAELRRRKTRPAKPLAVMVPDLDTARRLAEVSEDEARWLSGRERPIVLLRGRPGSALAQGISPDTGHVGLMLPYTPLHHVLFGALRKLTGPANRAALVMTSGNAGGEPICLGNREALRRLGQLADVFLLHDRDILIRADDSVVRVLPGPNGDGEIQFLRRARGFVPSPVELPEFGDGKAPTVLGLGPELKNTLCLTKGRQAFVGQHIGDMQNLETFGFWGEIREHLQAVLQVRPAALVRDLHPDYLTSQWAQGPEAGGLPVLAVQHHVAHVLAVLAENRATRPVVGLALDGTGYGADGGLWGGEALYVDPDSLEWRRLGHLAPLWLPGGEAAIREPWRIAQGALWSLGERDAGPWPWLKDFRPGSRLVAQMLDKGLNCPETSSCGRLFDAAAALLGLGLAVSYEGQAAMLLEAAQDQDEAGAYECPLLEGEPLVLDTLALLRQVRDDASAGVPVGVVSRRFHLGLVAGLAALAARAAEVAGVRAVALSGGCMLNRTLATELPRLLAERGVEVLTHRLLPPGDGCISLGQAVYGLRRLALGRAQEQGEGRNFL